MKILPSPSPTSEAPLQYTQLDPNSQEGLLVLNSQLLSQSAPDIRQKFKRLDGKPSNSPEISIEYGI